MSNTPYYASYKNYMVKLDTDERMLELTEERHGVRATMLLSGLYENGECKLDFKDFTSCKVRRNMQSSNHELVAVFSGDPEKMPSPELHINVDARGITIYIAEIGHYTFIAEGHIFYGDENAASINTKDMPGDALRAAMGPATSKYDNAIYDRITDTAAEISGCRELSIKYDFNIKRYKYQIKTKSEGVAERIRFTVIKDVLADKYAIDYAPMKLGRKYATPPAGLMTWYSLKFNACEELVLKNAKFQSEQLKRYGANTIWVDWEWCHRRYERERFDGVDNFHPDPEKYPNGLGYVSSEIKKLGLVPALWMGFTNDACFTDYEREHPEISLSHHDTWSGRYYYDLSHPEYLNGYLTKAVNQIKDWGYEAVKYDTLPNCITAHENYHANMLHPEMTTYSAFREMIKKTREILGEDYYMVSCGSAEQAILWGTGFFDAARIGPDLFSWAKYIETVGRMRKYYALHSNATYCDPDCVVLRDEYSNYNQAKSRMLPVSLLGMPLNLGDDLTELPAERVDLIKKALPTINAHPTDFNTPIGDDITQLVVLKIALDYESYTASALINLTDKKRERVISISDTLRLEDGKYIVYDYFAGEMLGIFDKDFVLTVDPYDTKLICVRHLTGIPQLVSTSRHYTQGAVEVSDVNWCEESATLTITSDLLSEDRYEMAIYVPDGYVAENCTVGYVEQVGNIARVRTAPPCDGKYDFVIQFSKK